MQRRAHFLRVLGKVGRGLARDGHVRNQPLEHRLDGQARPQPEKEVQPNRNQHDPEAAHNAFVPQTKRLDDPDFLAVHLFYYTRRRLVAEMPYHDFSPILPNE